MASTAQKVLLSCLNLPALTFAQADWDDFKVDFSNVDLRKLFDPATGTTRGYEDQSWKLDNGQIFAILITFFIVVFLTILCCASRRKNKSVREPPTAPSPPLFHAPSLCHSCQSTVHSVSQIPVSEDPYPPTYDSIYSTAQSRAMFLHHDQNRHSAPPPSAPPVNDLPPASVHRF